MIFDEICKNIEFTVDDVNGDKGFIEGNFHLGELLRKKKVSFPELLYMYEDDSANATILFYETKDGELDAEINFYDDPNDSSVADIYLRGDSFTEYLSRYCGAK